MKGQVWNKSRCLLSLLVLLCFSCAIGIPERKIIKSDERLIAKSQKPNVIIIVGESHRGDALGVMGHPIVQTPHLDALALEGTLFKKSYVTTAICTVSRASLLTGQHVARHGLNTPAAQMAQSTFDETLPMLMKKKGYEVAWFGDVGFGVPSSISSAFVHYQPDIPWLNNGEHNTDAIVRSASSWLQAHDTTKPFFMQLNFNAAHEIDPVRNIPAHYVVQERYKALYEDVDVDVPASSDPSVWESFPDFFKTNDNVARARWYGFFDNPAVFQKSSKDYYRLITGLDEAVGTLRTQLTRLGLVDNTIVIYTSDHGFSLGEHGIMGKWFPFEESIHVPLLIFNPMEPLLLNNVVSSPVLNIDIAPTVLHMVGGETSKAMQGVSLVELARETIAPRKYYFYQHTLFGSPLLPAVEAVAGGDLKYVKFIEHNYEILYDRRTDPEETRNVVNDPAYLQQLKEMRSIYHTLKGEVK